MTCSGFAPTGPCPSYAGDPRTGHSTLGWVSPEWSRGEQSPSLTASYFLHYFHTGSWWGHLIQSWLRSHCNKFSDKQMLEQCLKKVKNSPQLFHGEISKALLLLFPPALSAQCGVGNPSDHTHLSFTVGSAYFFSAGCYSWSYTVVKGRQDGACLQHNVFFYQ